MTTTLTDFLLARITEDKKGAKRIHAERCATPHVTILDTMGRPMTPVCDCDWHVARVLAACEAKRELVAGWSAFIDGAPEWAKVDVPSVLEMGRRTLRLLALPYADHPDYDETWRP